MHCCIWKVGVQIAIILYIANDNRQAPFTFCKPIEDKILVLGCMGLRKHHQQIAAAQRRGWRMLLMLLSRPAAGWRWGVTNLLRPGRRSAASSTVVDGIHAAHA